MSLRVSQRMIGQPRNTGSQVRLVVEHTDLLDVEVDARFQRVLAEPETQDDSLAADAFGPL